jgi:hypothetical protein
MTQRLCQTISEAEGPVTVGTVDRLCTDLFLTKSARESDDNLAFARNRMLRSEEDVAALLDLYQRVLRGQPVACDETNPLTSVLELAGVVREEEGLLRTRNRVYRTVFDRRWVLEHMPDAELRRQRAAYRRGVVRAATVGILGALVLGALTSVAVLNARTARTAALAARRNLDLAQRQTRVADLQRRLAEQADLHASLLAEQRRLALDSAFAARTSAGMERKRADAAAIMARVEREHAAAEKRRADLAARMSGTVAQAMAGQQPPQPAQSDAAPLREGPAAPRPMDFVAATRPVPFWLFVLQPAGAEMVTRHGETQVTVTAVDEYDWHVEAVYPLEGMENDVLYHLRFRARAAPARDVEINVQVGNGDFHTVVSPRPHARLTSAWRAFDFAIKPHDLGEQNQIAFFLGTKVGNVWLRDASVRRDAPVPSAPRRQGR